MSPGGRDKIGSADCPYRLDGSPGEGEPTEDGDHFCRTNPGGFIETADGATVWFDVKGFGLLKAGPQTGLAPDRVASLSNQGRKVRVVESSDRLVGGAFL